MADLTSMSDDRPFHGLEWWVPIVVVIVAVVLGGWIYSRVAAPGLMQTGGTYLIVEDTHDHLPPEEAATAHEATDTQLNEPGQALTVQESWQGDGHTSPVEGGIDTGLMDDRLNEAGAADDEDH